MYKRVGYVNYNLDSRIWQKQRKEIFLCQKSSRSKHDGDNDEWLIQIPTPLLQIAFIMEAIDVFCTANPARMLYDANCI